MAGVGRQMKNLFHDKSPLFTVRLNIAKLLINNNISQFIARLYSEDKRTALQGGEYGFVGKVSLDPTFATAVFNLSLKRIVSPF